MLILVTIVPSFLNKLNRMGLKKNKSFIKYYKTSNTGWIVNRDWHKVFFARFNVQWQLLHGIAYHLRLQNSVQKFAEYATIFARKFSSARNLCILFFGCWLKNIFNRYNWDKTLYFSFYRPWESLYIASTLSTL